MFLASVASAHAAFQPHRLGRLRAHASRTSAPRAVDPLDASGDDDDGEDAFSEARSAARIDLGLDDNMRQYFRSIEPAAKPAPTRRNKPASTERKRKVSESCKGTNTYTRSMRHRRLIAITQLQRYAQMTPEQRMNRCRACGQLGHRVATCEVAKARKARAAVWAGLILGDEELVARSASGRARRTGGGANVGKQSASAALANGAAGAGTASKQTTVRVSKPRARAADKKAGASNSSTAGPSAAPGASTASRAAQSAARPDGSGRAAQGLSERGHSTATVRAAASAAGPPAAARAPGEQGFGSGLAMPTLDDPFYAGPVRTDTVFPLPTTTEMTAELAWTAAYRAWLDGERLQTMSLPITLPPRSRASMPPSTTQLFKAALKLAESVMSSLKRQKPLQGPLKGELLYEADEPIGKWEGERMAAVIYPTADTLGLIRGVVDSGRRDRLVVCVNPQWVLAGQVVSDFGFGESSQRAEAFIKSFVEVFYVKRLNVRGDDVTILHVYPSGWQVHWMNPPGKDHPLLLEVEYKLPSYDRLVELLRAQPGSRTSMSWVDRMRSSLEPTLRGITGSFSSADEDSKLDSDSFDIIAGPATVPARPARPADELRALRSPLRASSAAPLPAPASAASFAEGTPTHRPGTHGAVLARAALARGGEPAESGMFSPEVDDDAVAVARARQRKLKAADDAEAAERQALLGKLKALEVERERILSELAAMAAE